jgi:hypothetical protein
MVIRHNQTEETDGDHNRQREGWPAGDHSPQPRPLHRAVRQLSHTNGH